MLQLQVYCWPFPKRPDLQRADSYWVDRVIDYLVAVKGIATADPRECVKLACLGDATAYLCNDVCLKYQSPSFDVDINANNLYHRQSDLCVEFLHKPSRLMSETSESCA